MTKEQIKELFRAIERDDIDWEEKEMLTNGVIDSLDIISLVAEIEKHYKKPLKADFITDTNFQSLDAIESMLKEAFK